MKYTKEQAQRLKDKAIDGYTKWTMWKAWNPLITHYGEFYIIESKINNPYFK